METKNFEDACSKVQDKNHEVDADIEVEEEIKKMKLECYSSEFLNELTSNLSDSCRVGKGGYGNVYKARLPTSGKQVAIKVLESKDIVEENETFLAEVKTMSNTNHRNIIKLIGCCFKPNMKALVYEYMEKGSLDTFLYNKSDIKWETFYGIAIEIAEGLRYFHESSNEQIIHYDIKAANVVLDNNLSPKIIDFGLAKLFNRDVKEVNLTKIRGTPLYTAPELLSQMYGGKVTNKCDVFSFGMLLFEILGKRKVKQEGAFFPKQVWNSFCSKELERLFNDIGITEKNRKKANILAKVALLCINDNPNERPSMKDVYWMLDQKTCLREPSLPTKYWKIPTSSTASVSSNRMSDDDTSGSSGNNISWSNQDTESISSSLKDKTHGSTVSVLQEEKIQPCTREEGLEGTWEKINLKNGAIYEGTMKDGLRHGKGKIVWTSGNMYDGEWKDDFQEGRGKHQYEHGDYYEGTYKKGVREGQGKYVYNSGNEYVGESKNGKFEGQGKFVYKNGNEYVGEFKNGAFEGQGRYVYKNGNEYVGEFKNWKQEGHGKFIYKNGSYHEGTYKNGLKDGKGRLVSASGEEHHGEWIKGIRQDNEEIHYNSICEKNDDEAANQSTHNDRSNQWNASCTMEEGLEGTWKKITYENGGIYEGTWKNGLRHGKGRFLYTNGSMYVGEWKDGFRDGRGKYKFENGDYYEGTHKKGVREGQGKFVCADGQVYIGEFRNELRNGKGKLHLANGDEYVGEFKNGKFEGHGKFIYKNGSYHEGSYKNGLKDGKGRLVNANGEKHGEWIKGIPQ